MKFCLFTFDSYLFILVHYMLLAKKKNIYIYMYINLILVKCYNTFMSRTNYDFWIDRPL